MLEPLINFIQTVKIRRRLFSTLILLSIPILFLGYFMISTQNRAIQFGEKEIIGVDYNFLLIKTLYNMRNILSSQYSSTSAIDSSQLNSIHTDINKMESKYEKVLETKELYTSFLTDKMQMEEKIKLNDSSETQKSILKFIDSILKLNSHIGDTSNLILDPDLDSYYLMDISLIKIPTLFATSTEIENILAKSYQTKNLSDQDKIELFTLHSEINSTLEQMENSFNVAFKYNAKLKTILQTRIENSLKNINLYKNKVYEIANPTNKENDFSKIAIVLGILPDYNQSVFLVYEETINAQRGLLEKRVSNFKIEQYISIALVILVVCLTVIIQYLIVISITNPLLVAVSKFESLSKGNLNNKIEYDGRDEIGQLSHSINHFIEYLKTLIHTISNLTNESNTIFNEITSMTKQLSLSTENQASGAEESAAALEEISSNFNQIANLIEKETSDISEIGAITDEISISTTKATESIHNLGSLIESSAKEVKKGETVIVETVNSMNQIKAAADEISKIILLITEISKQIGLLALNASIEAARAGENGKGFSVVADEISKLSLKTEESVKLIRSLIGSTNASIKEGILNVGTVVDVLKVVIEKINSTNKNAKLVDEEISSQSTNISIISNSHSKLENLSDDIDKSAKEEKLAIRQISENINRIAMETQIISENIGNLREAALKIASVSNELTTTVNVFQL